MKMMSRTSTTSTSGVMLISERTPLFAPTSIPIGYSSGLRLRRARAGRGRRRRRRLLVGPRVRQRLVETAFLEEEVDQLIRRVRDVDRHLFHAVGQVVE